jgi:Ca-activated chloride channel family protein
MASPTMEVDRIIPRDVVLVLDTSGSMEGDKLEQAKSAATYVLKHLNSEDRFNIIAFSTGINHFAYDLQSRSRVDEAISWLAKIPSLGGTNINLALLEALSLNNVQDDIQPGRPMVILFLTDGLPTEGITDIYQIIDNVAGSAGKNLRFFAFGVGDDVNTELLDTLTTDNQGQVQYVRPGEKIDEEVSSLYAKIQAPVLTNLKLDFGDIVADEVYPAVLPDLYSGSQLIITGRYRIPVDSSGRTRIKLSGQVNSGTETYVYQADFTNDQRIADANSYIPRLWATRKIGYLLNQIRYQGENPEWVDAIIQLSLRYGIITPYTSFLIEEHDVFTSEGLDQAADELAETYSGPVVGAEAVGKADAESNLRSAESISQPAMSENKSGQQFEDSAIKYVADKTFIFQDGVWIDSEFDPSENKPIKIGFGSEAYFDLLSRYSSLGKILSLGDQVIFIINGDVYEIITDEEGVSSLPPIEIWGQKQGEDDQLSEDKFTLSKLFQSVCSAPFFTGLVLIIYPWRKEKTARFS